MTGAHEQGAPHPDAPAAKAPPDRLGRVLKWIGGVSAVLSLLFALVQANNLVSGRVERGRRLREAEALARRQLELEDYPTAWTSAQAAAAIDPGRAEVRRLQEDVAMAWLRQASIAVSGESGAPMRGARAFGELVDPLVATLDRGALDATGARRGDLLAHRGWAEFLRGRDDAAQRRDPTPFYRAAIDADAGNPYAHAMWGLVTAWRRDSLRAARDHFAAAVAGGRERPYVRRLQVAALIDDGSPEGVTEVLRVVDAIRREGGTVTPGARRRLHGAYWFAMADPGRRAALLASLPADAHLATYRWLFADDLRDTTREPSYSLYLAALQEQAGDTAGALDVFRRLRAAPVSWRQGEQALIDAALARAARARRQRSR